MVEQTNAASHSLAQKAEKLTGLIGQFKVSDTPVGSPSHCVRRAAVSTPSSRQNAGRVVLRAVSHAGAAAARKIEAAVEEGWGEF